MIGNRDRAEAVTHSIEDRRYHHCQKAGDQTESDVPQVLGKRGRRQVFRHDEQRIPARHQAIDREGNHRGEHGVHERRGIELHVPVQHLDREDRRTNGRSEHRRQTCGHAHQHQQPALFVGTFGQRGIDGTNASADQRGRSFAADGLQRRDPRSDEPSASMEGLYRRVGPMPLGLGCEAID